MDVKEGPQTVTWTSDELHRISRAEELEIASLRNDGTLRNPVTIWVVRVGNDIYVRSWRGRSSAWLRGTQVRHIGHIHAGGVDKDVTFIEETDRGINRQIDDAYRSKYSHHDASYVEPMVSKQARSATIKIVPRG
jgi:hypothetical protein